MTEQLTEAELLLSQALLTTAIEGPKQSKAAALAYQRKAISPGGRPANDSSLARKPGKEDNWVEKAGGLPKYIRMVAHALIRDHGYTTSRAIATAVNRMKKWAVSGKDPKVKAAAAAALAEWNAKRGKARAEKRDAAYLELKRERRVRTPEGAARFGKPIGSIIGGFRFMNDTQMDAEFGARKRRYTYADGEHATLHESGDIVLSSGDTGQYEHDVYASMNDEQAEELVGALVGAINGASTWNPDDPDEEREIDSETGWVEEFDTTNGTRVGFDAVGDIGIIFPTTEAAGDEGVAGRGADEHHLSNSEARNLTNAVHSLVYEHRNGGDLPDDELFEDPDLGYDLEVDAQGRAYIPITTEALARRFNSPVGTSVWAPEEKSAWQVGMETRETFNREHPPGGFNFPKGSPAGAEKSLRRVRTPQGARMFGQPIGSVIRPDVDPARSSPEFHRREKLQRGLKQPRTPVIRMVHGGWYRPAKLFGRVDQIQGYTSQGTRLKVWESGRLEDKDKNVWHWEASNPITGQKDSGVVSSEDEGMEFAELAAQIIDNAQTPLPDQFDGLTRVSPDLFIWEGQPDANGVVYGIEANFSDPKWWYTTIRVAGSQDVLHARNAKGHRHMADREGAIQNIEHARKQAVKAVKQGEGKLDMARLAVRRPRGTTWTDFSYGLRGRDWGTDRDLAFDASTEKGRREIAERDSRDLGLYVYDETPRGNGRYPLEYQEVLNAVMWAYNTMYPGVVGIMQTHSIGRAESGKNTLAWNSTHLKPARYPTMADKRGILSAEIRFVKSKWVKPSKPAPGGAPVDPTAEGRTGLDLGHFAGRWGEIVENNPHGWSTDQLSYVITLQHEIGHTIHEVLFDSGGADPDVTRQFWELLHSLGLSTALGDPNKPDPEFNNAAAKLLVSDYSGTNIREFLAEIWAEYMLDPEPREVVGLVGDYMARALSKWLADRSDIPALGPREAKVLVRSVRAPGGDWTRMEVKVRYVRTPEGADHYGVPIGTPITADLIAARDRGVPQGKKPVLHEQAEPDMVSAAPYQRGMLPPDTKMPGSKYTAAQVDEALDDLDGPGWDPIRHMLTTTYEDPYWQETVDAIDSAMQPSERPVQGFQPISDPARVFGPSWSEETSMRGLVFENPVYAPISQDWRGTSGSAGKGKAVMRIGAPAGSKMVGMDESTLLLDRGGQYEIADDYGYVDGVRQLEVVKLPEEERRRVPFSADMPAPKKATPKKRAPAKKAPAKKPVQSQGGGTVTREQAAAIMHGSNPDLSKMTVPDLRTLAKQRGVMVDSKARKADLVAALERAAKPAAAPKPKTIAQHDADVARLEKQIETLQGKLGMAGDKRRKAKGGRIASSEETRLRGQIFEARQALSKAKQDRDEAAATSPPSTPPASTPGLPQITVPKGGWTEETLVEARIGRTARGIILDSSKTKAQKRQALYKHGYSTEELDLVLPWEAGDEKGPDNIGPDIGKTPVDDLTKEVIDAQQRVFKLETELRGLERARRKNKQPVGPREKAVKAELARLKKEQVDLERRRIGKRASPEKLARIREKYKDGHDYASVKGQPEQSTASARVKAPLSEHKPGQWSTTSRAAERKLDFERTKPTLIEGARRAGYSEAEIKAELERMEQGYSEVFPDDPTERIYRNGPHQVIISGDAVVPEADLAAFQAHLDKLLTQYPPTRPMRVEIVAHAGMAKKWGKGGSPYGFTQVGEGGTLAPVSTVVISDLTFADGGVRKETGKMTFEGGADYKMPSVSKVPSYIYTLTHEFGHTRDYRGSGGHHFQGHHDHLEDGHDHNHDDDILHEHGGHMSGYGRTNPAESYAEAFAEWVNTDGKTDNPAVRAYAERFNW